MLNRIWNRIFQPIIPIIKIEAPYVDLTMSARVDWRLSKINKKKAKGIAVYIDTEDGSLAQCEIIKDKIQKFCDQNKLPLYTFAGNKALGVGYYLLSMGNKIYVSESSVVGGIGIEQTIIQVDPLLERNGIDYRFLKAKNFLYRQTRMGKEICEEDIKILQTISNKRYSNFVKCIESQGKKNHNIESVEKIFHQNKFGMLTGLEAVNSGIANGLGTYEYVLQKEFPGARRDEYVHRDLLHKLSKFFTKVHKISTSRWIPIIFVGYMVGSTIIEVYLFYLSAQYASGGEKKQEKESKNANLNN